MSLAIKYEGVNDAQLRLRHTVVMYKETPVYIKDIGLGETKEDILRVCFEELPIVRDRIPDDDDKPFGRARKLLLDDGGKRKYISSKHFDIAPFKLGYINNPKGEGAFYCSRVPNRVQKQGLCAENFKGVTNFGKPVDFRVFLGCKETLAMVNNDYPSVLRASQLLDKVPAVAFHREFCLVKDQVIPQLVYLYYKGVKVGMYREGEATLGNKFNCLKETLSEMKIRVGAF